MWDDQPGLFGFPSKREDANICIFGAPFDGTASGHAGSRFAPQAIRNVWPFLELYSPRQDRDVDELKAIDVGDIPIPIGNTKGSLQLIKEAVISILENEQIPVMMGGEHLCTLPAFEAVQARYPDLHIIQFDAHTDLRHEYLGETLSHATVMRRVLEYLPTPQHMLSYGLRSGLREEFVIASSCRMAGPPHATQSERMAAVSEHLNAIKGAPLYLTFDLDLFDPAIFPGTGTPEPGGIMFEEFGHIVEVLRGQRIVAMDIMELCPPVAPSDASAILAAKVIRELLLLLA